MAQVGKEGKKEDVLKEILEELKKDKYSVDEVMAVFEVFQAKLGQKLVHVSSVSPLANVEKISSL